MDIFNIYKSKISNSGIKIIYDDIDYHHLRSLSILKYFGFKYFTYPHSWKIYDADFIDYQYILDKYINARNIQKDLVCISNQYYETYEPQYSINKIIKKYLKSEESNLVLILDKRNLEIKGKFRPLDEEYFIHSVYSYNEIYQNIMEKYNQEEFTFSFRNTKNLFFQDMSILINEISNDEIVNFKDLFEGIFRYPYLPIWSFFSKIFGRKGSLIPTKRIEREKLIKFFLVRFELKKSKLERILKKFLDELNLTNIHLLDPTLLRRNVKVGFSKEIENFKKRICNIHDDILRNRFSAYIKDL